MESLKVLYTVLEVLIAVACCLGNLMVIWAVWTCGAMRRQPTFCFIVSLAVADFLVGAVAVPVAVLVDGQVITSFNGCLFLSCMLIVLTQASVHSLLAIALDRFLRVYIPLRYKSTVTQIRSWSVVGACWVSASILGFVPMFGWHRQDTLAQMEDSNSTTITCTFLAVIPMSYMVNFNFLTCILPPMLLMLVLYLCIFMRIHQQLRGGGVSGSGSHSYYHKEWRLARSLLLILVLFAVCWLPLHFMNVASLYGPPLTVPHQAFYVGILLSHANSAVNPVVYALKIHKIKHAFKTMWGRYMLCKEDQETTRSSQTTENINSITTTNRNEQNIRV
ncbi:adenosine receptor A1-like [Clupea harengus]|uniref:Adenosine receptor A1-like n=1 Tax=Clupea harengus TaxID=7950 RepID=A0A6P3W6L7_CLUHA|nr:adenosine receptor A1-like [Clupea harengus]